MSGSVPTYRLLKVLVLGFLPVLGASAGDVPIVAATGASAALAVANPEHDFGLVRAGTTVEHDFVVKNGGSAVARILNVRSSCGCTAGQASATELPPGGTSTIHTRFDTSGRSGTQNKSVYITTDVATSPLLVCRLLGTVEAPPLSPSVPPVPPAGGGSAVDRPVSAPGAVPKSKASAANPNARLPLHDAGTPDVPAVLFGRVWNDERPRRDVALTNTGAEALRIRSVTDDCGCLTATVDRRTIGPGETGILTLELHPGDTKRELRQTVRVSTDEPGAAPVLLQVRGDIVPRVEALPAVLQFFNTPAGGTVERVVRLTSNDGMPFRIVRIVCGVNGVEAESAPGATEMATDVKFRFAAPAAPGPVGGVVHIVTDRPTGGTVTIPVVGATAVTGGS